MTIHELYEFLKETTDDYVICKECGTIYGESSNIPYKSQCPACLLIDYLEFHK